MYKLNFDELYKNLDRITNFMEVQMLQFNSLNEDKTNRRSSFINNFMSPVISLTAVIDEFNVLLSNQYIVCDESIRKKSKEKLEQLRNSLNSFYESALNNEMPNKNGSQD